MNDKQYTKNDKPDTKKKDTKRKDTKNKDKEKKDIKKKDTKKEDKPDNIEKHNNGKKKDTKNKDTKKEDKPDNIKKYNDKPPKTLNTIDKIVNRFICGNFMNEKYYEKVDKDGIVFYLINKPIKVVKMEHVIEISRVMIILAIEKETRIMNEVITICIIDNQIKLNLAQTENQNKLNISIIVSNDEIVCNTSSITDEHEKDIVK